jgi:hypothetical protein
MKKLLLATALLATACTPSQSQSPPHKFVTECQTTIFYGMGRTECYEVDVTQRWIDSVGAQQPLREDDNPELRAAKLKYQLRERPLLREDDPPDLRAAKEAAFAEAAADAKLRNPHCTWEKRRDCIFVHGELYDPLCHYGQRHLPCPKKLPPLSNNED